MTNSAQNATDRQDGEASPRGAAPRIRRRVRTPSGDRQRRKKLWKYGLLLFSAGLMVNALIGEKGYLANLQARQEYQEAHESLEQLRAENARLREVAKRLLTDPKTLEDSARSQLGLIKPGETLITLRDRPASRD
jgi:cell division protein FtsB